MPPPSLRGLGRLEVVVEQDRGQQGLEGGGEDTTQGGVQDLGGDGGPLADSCCCDLGGLGSSGRGPLSGRSESGTRRP